MSLLTPAIGLLFWMLVVFLLLVVILRSFAWKPIIAGLKDRENEIQSALDLAERTKAEMAQLQADNAKLLAEANAARDRIIREAKDASDRMIAEAREKATEEGQKVIESARQTIRNEQQAAISQMRKEVAALSLQIAEQVLRRELNDKVSQEKLVAELASNARMN
ncbi:F0F1 ATP synthase subunit B [Telluribacter sp.]|jgi:F-type H+-transporting ATPase subunit b|uniref:F0F1 ATP synthase subunit B n=1 Tax=Telluribacter sp. TaxID=1978767 RepID=UPI002E14C1DD|nr:F0F1 ATP synthase subunit B [Telluribacter sp.]